MNVRPADKLTQETAVDILANNEAREAVGCKYEPPAKASPQRVAKATP